MDTRNNQDKPQFLYNTAQKNQVDLQQIVEGSAGEHNNSSSQTDKLREMSEVGKQFNAIRAAEKLKAQNPIAPPSQFIEQSGDLERA